MGSPKEGPFSHSASLGPQGRRITQVPRGRAYAYCMLGVQPLILHFPKCLVARRGGLQWGEAQYGAEAVQWL